jgi:hypothetical protein
MKSIELGCESVDDVRARDDTLQPRELKLERIQSGSFQPYLAEQGVGFQPLLSLCFLN